MPRLPIAYQNSRLLRGNDKRSFVYLFIYGTAHIPDHVTSSNGGEKKQLHGLNPLANYTDRATAACWRSDCQVFADRGCHVVSVTDPYGRILNFLDRSRNFSIK
jgi:hypothetical protein